MNSKCPGATSDKDAFAPRAEFSDSGLSKSEIKTLASICDAIVVMLGPQCEAIVHDLTDIEHSIVYIAGNVTDRSVGGSITDLGLNVITSNPNQLEPLAYFARSPRGNRLKCVSVLIRDASSNRVQGALCINLNIDALSGASAMLDTLIGLGSPANVEERFDTKPEDIVVQKTNETITNLGLDLSSLEGDDRYNIVQELNERGVFAFKSAHSIVANTLGVSRATIYNYLKR